MLVEMNSVDALCLLRGVMLNRTIIFVGGASSWDHEQEDLGGGRRSPALLTPHQLDTTASTPRCYVSLRWTCLPLPFVAFVSFSVLVAILRPRRTGRPFWT